jgi:hypothetical protein
MKRVAIATSTLFLTLCTSLWLASAMQASSGSSQNANTSDPMAEELVSREKALSDALKKHDRDAYKNALTDNFISIGADGKVHPKDELMSDFGSTDLLEYRPYNVQVVQLNPDASVVTYDVIVRMAHYDDETPRYQHVSSIWVKQAGDWKLKFQQATAWQ